MIILLGLGNNEAKYLNTKHNVGRIIVEKLAASWNCTFGQQKNYFWTNSGKSIDGQKILKMNQDRKILEAKAELQKSQLEIAQQKDQKEQLIDKILEEGSKEVMEAQERLAQLVAQNEAKKEAAKNQLGQISQEEITKTSQLILKTFESFGVKVQPMDTSELDKGKVIVRVNGKQNGINIAKQTIQGQNSGIKFEISSQKLDEQILVINFGK